MAKTNTELTSKLNQQLTTNGKAKTPTVADSVRMAIEKMKDQIALALPKHITPDRLCRITLTTIRTNTKLLSCSIESLLAATMQAAQLGLEPGLLGQCYFVPFGNSVTFIIGYRGLIDLVRRSGQIVSLGASPIYSKDRFLYRKGFDEKLEHEPNFSDRGELIGFYAYATTKDGGRYADVMTLTEVNKIRSRSKAGNSGPWVTDFEEMGKKTVFRRLSKWLPLSIEQQAVIRSDEEKEYGTFDGQPVSAIELNLGSEAADSPTVEFSEAEKTEIQAQELRDSATDVYDDGID